MSGRPSSEPSELEAAAARLLAAFTDGREPAPLDVTLLDGALASYVRKRFAAPDADDIAAETMIRFLEHARQAGLSIEVPIAYLYRMAFNIASRSGDRGRIRTGTSGPAMEAARDDDRVAASVDRISASSDIRDALSAAAKGAPGGGPDAVAVRILATFLDLADRGQDTSTRAVASAAECSHTTVERVYGQARSFLLGGRKRWPSRTRPDE